MTEQLTPSQRNEFIGDSQRLAREALLIPEVQRRLGGYAGELYELTNSIVPVEMSGSTIRINERYPRGVPVAALRANEEAFRLASAEPFDEYQSRALRKRYGYAGRKEWRRLHKEKFPEGSASSLPFVNGSLAYVHSDSFKLPGEQNIAMARGRGLVVLNYDRTNGFPMVGPPTLNHELWHKKQRRKSPVWDNSEGDFSARDLKEELETYAIGAATILGIRDANQAGTFLHSTPSDSIERTLEVDAIRQKANQYEADPYAATHKAASELIKNGHGITPFLRAKINEKK